MAARIMRLALAAVVQQLCLKSQEAFRSGFGHPANLTMKALTLIPATLNFNSAVQEERARLTRANLETIQLIWMHDPRVN